MVECIFLVLFVCGDFAETHCSLISLQSSEKGIHGSDHQIFINISQKNDDIAKFSLDISSSSNGCSLSRYSTFSAKEAADLVDLMLLDGLLCLPSQDHPEKGDTVYREIIVKIKCMEEVKLIRLHAYGKVELYDFGSEENEWEKWISKARKKNLNSEPVPSWIYNRMFQRLYSLTILMPIQTLEEFCRRGGY